MTTWWLCIFFDSVTFDLSYKYSYKHRSYPARLNSYVTHNSKAHHVRLRIWFLL